MGDERALQMQLYWYVFVDQGNNAFTRGGSCHGCIFVPPRGRRFEVKTS